MKQQLFNVKLFLNTQQIRVLKRKVRMYNFTQYARNYRYNLTLCNTEKQSVSHLELFSDKFLDLT